MNNGDYSWDHLIEHASSNSQKLLTQQYYWECCDDDSPLGNDTGADTLCSYAEWRAGHPTASVEEFIEETLKGWQIENGGWDVVNEAELEQALADDHFSVIVRDDFIIGLAFSQLVLEGKVDKQVTELAKAAVRRQAADAVITFRGWSDPAERRSRLADIGKVLEAI